MNLLQIIDFYLDEKKFLLEEGTKKKYLFLRKKLELAGLGELNAEMLNKKHLETYIFYCLWVRNNQNKTINKELKALNAVLNFAREKKKIKNDYTCKIYLKENEALRRYLSETQLIKLFRFYYKRKNKVLKTPKQREVLKMFLFACLTGLRYSDLMRLQWEDFHFGEQSYFQIVVKKKRRVLTIPLPKKAEKLLGKAGSGKLFPELTNQYINRVLRKIQRACGINTKMTMHTARHTYATLLLNRGTPVGVVSELLGHSKIETTKIYAKLFPGTKKNFVTKLDEIFTP